MHGASAVSIPAMNDMTSKIMLLFYLTNERSKSRACAPFCDLLPHRIYLHKRVLVRHAVFRFQRCFRIVIYIEDGYILWD